MTILEWLKASTRYTFEETTFQNIALDRKINDALDATTLSVRDKELLKADIIFTAVMFSPSSTSSQSASHNGFSKSVGSETDIYQGKKVDYALSVYEKYKDPNYDILLENKPTIKLLTIEDII